MKWNFNLKLCVHIEAARMGINEFYQIAIILLCFTLFDPFT